MLSRLVAAALAAATVLIVPAAASADVVGDWNQTMITALEVAKTPPPPSARIGAIVQSAVFDAANGVVRRYTPVHVAAAAPPDTSATAAAAGAAHEALVALFPSQQPLFDARLASSLAGLSGDPGAIARGLAWGASVADQTIAWRASDGFATAPPPYTLTAAPGRYQLTPPNFGPPLFRQFATMTPFAIAAAAQFMPGPPPALTSAQYTRDFNEVKALGGAHSTRRTPEQTQTAIFWQAASPVAIWDRVADQIGNSRGGGLIDRARIVALVDISLADATIAVWNAKNTYDTWRPITAITQADTDGSPGTTPDRGWTPLLVTPAFQEYPAGHPGVSNAAASVLARFYGEASAFTVTSYGLPGVSRSFTSFGAAVAQVEDARVWGGIHFRTACRVGAHMGAAVAGYVMATHLLPIR